ncbi:TniQ family protein [Streptomyces sp. NPDC058321]|uniref:TniQ family protein n=1 Tax=Streptomyces sp. NPDC058321 TaxID=3346445 RepID=UPI0036E431C7
MAGRDPWLGRRPLHLRLRFLQGESTGSYVTRLAARNMRPVEQLLASIGAGPMLPVEPQYTEMYVSRYGRERLANLSGCSVAELSLRLISLRDEFLLSDGSGDDWEWPWDARAGFIVQACSLCAARRATRAPAWLILPDPWHVCLRHGRWTDNSRSLQSPYIDLREHPGVVRAQQRLNRLRKRLGYAAARWLEADALSVLTCVGYLENPSQSMDEWGRLAARVGEQRARPVAQFGMLTRLAWDMAWLEERRRAGRLSAEDGLSWLRRVEQRYDVAFNRPLASWISGHQPLQHTRPQGEGVGTNGRDQTEGVGHGPAPLASLQDLTCLPWVRMPNEMDRLFL